MDTQWADAGGAGAPWPPRLRRYLRLGLGLGLGSGVGVGLGLGLGVVGASGHSWLLQPARRSAATLSASLCLQGKEGEALECRVGEAQGCTCPWCP